jgi:hypothetical protein
MNSNTTTGVFEELSRQADEQLEAQVPAEWGEMLELAESEKFFGRYLGDAINPLSERTVRLLLTPDGSPTWYPDRTMLASEMERVRPQRGDNIVIARGDDGEGKNGVYHRYAVVAAPCAKPLPELVAASGGDADIPF